MSKPVKHVDIVLSAGIWKTRPPTFKLEFSEVEFTNTSTEFDVRIEFSCEGAELSPLEIGAEQTEVLHVPNGQFPNIPSLYARTKGSEGQGNLRPRTGNGPNMDIDNP